jgi:hypothetical protein
VQQTKEIDLSERQSTYLGRKQKKTHARTRKKSANKMYIIDTNARIRGKMSDCKALPAGAEAVVAIVEE